MSQETHFDYIRLNKNILIQLFEHKNIDYLSQYLNEDVKILGLHSKKTFEEGLIEHLKSTEQYNITNTDFYIITENDQSCVIEGIVEITKNNVEPFVLELTIVYECSHSKVTITHIHFSHPNYKKQEVIATPLAGLCSYYCDDNLTLRSINDTFASMLGYSKEEFLELYQHNTFNLVCEHDKPIFRKAIQECLETRNNFHVEYRAAKKDGTLIWVMEQGEIFTDDHGKNTINSFISDISFLKKSELDLAVQKQKYSLALKDNSITILEYDIKNDRVIIDIQEESKKKIYEHYLDYVASERSTVFDEDKHLVLGLFKRTIPGPIEIREHIRGTNQYLRKSIDSVIINDDKGNPAIVLATAKDITTEWNHKAILEQKAQRDALTHILNLEGGKEKIEDYLSHRPNHEPFALMILDIDYFKTINDNYGHLFGNNVLVAFAQCLNSLTRGNDIVARIGGDEFIILLKNINRSQTFSKAQSIVESVRKIQLDKGSITTSIGVFVADEENALYVFEQMFKNADLALYQAKKHGRDGFQFYDKDKDVHNQNIESFDHLYDRIVQSFDEDIVTVEDVKNALKMIGIHYQFNRISQLRIDTETQNYIHRDLWVSSRAYRGYDVEDSLDHNDFEMLMNFPSKIMSIPNDTLILSPKMKEVIKHGVSKHITIICVDEGHFLSFVDYEHQREITDNEQRELIELVDLLHNKRHTN